MPTQNTPPDFHKRLKAKLATKDECIDATSACLQRGDVFEAIYILDVALVRFPASRQLRANMANILAKMISADSIRHILDGLPERGGRIRVWHEEIRQKFTDLHGPDAKRPGSQAFLECVILKGLCQKVSPGQPLWNVLARMADFFGQRSASDAFNAIVHPTEMSDAVASITIGDRPVRFHVSSGPVAFDLQYFFLFEPGLLRWIATFSEDDVLLDIGANIGRYSLVAAAVKNCRTLAAEPFTPNYRDLVANIALNKADDRVTPLRVALADTTGEGNLSFDKETPGAAAQTFDELPGGGATTPPGVERVAGYRLDDLIAEGAIDFPNHIKIDVDGTEHRIIDGMPRTLADPRLRSIRLEIRLDDSRNAKALKKLEQAGFDWAIDDDEKNLLCLRV